MTFMVLFILIPTQVNPKNGFAAAVGSPNDCKNARLMPTVYQVNLPPFRQKSFFYDLTVDVASGPL